MSRSPALRFFRTYYLDFMIKRTRSGHTSHVIHTTPVGLHSVHTCHWHTRTSPRTTPRLCGSSAVFAAAIICFAPTFRSMKVKVTGPSAKRDIEAGRWCRHAVIMGSRENGCGSSPAAHESARRRALERAVRAPQCVGCRLEATFSMFAHDIN